MTLSNMILKDNEYYPDGTNQIMWDDLVDKTFFYKPVFVDLTETNKELWIGIMIHIQIKT